MIDLIWRGFGIIVREGGKASFFTSYVCVAGRFNTFYMKVRGPTTLPLPRLTSLLSGLPLRVSNDSRNLQ